MYMKKINKNKNILCFFFLRIKNSIFYYKFSYVKEIISIIYYLNISLLKIP